ncbi:MAG: helix-turn-helix transcriptional regulator [Firmicutes bacterium]|nr:helix-turn-helix transcriptional regulator [Bacillota bacterium]MBQ5440684.1 helix-turn-helix transcriptional regulator [Bacillota bacterium]
MNREYEILLGLRIKALRNSRKLTQESVVSQLQVLGCDITRSALAKIEVGQRHVYPDEIRALKIVLDVDYDDLLPE